MKFKSIILVAVILFTACKKEPNEPEPVAPVVTPAATSGSLILKFEAMVDTNALVFDTKNYVNANLDTFNVAKFKYFVSNVVLTKNDNSLFVVPNSYFLVDHKLTGANTITLTNIPVGSYKAVKFLIGIDSLRNVSGAQEGVLAPSANDMFWSWNSGYIFAKMEGSSPQSGNANKFITFHIGGFAGPNKSLKEPSISFNGNTANVSGSVSPEVHIATDLSKWFKGANTISLGSIHTVMQPGVNSLKLSANYVNMFNFEHIHQ